MKTYTDANRWSYQDDAISKIIAFFKKKKNSKGLLVIPTGGGKTLTALRAINKLFNENIITKKVLWVSHLKTLNEQTSSVIKEQLTKDKFLGKLELINPKLENVITEMVTSSVQKIKTSKEDYGLVVIDEAHHSASDGYDLLLGSGLPVLGLTATPTRLDGKELEYREIIYQTTPSDLFERKVIIRPEIEKISTNLSFDIGSVSSDNTVTKTLNNPKRNRIVVDTIFNNKNRFKKAIIFVRTKDHAKALYTILNIENTRFSNYYEKIGYVFGDENDEDGTGNKEYLKQNKKHKRSIIINCGVLTEGFDDPSINTSVMVCPSKSTNYIMQCVGRALRRNPELGDEQQKFLVQFVDDLPNVNYRFDNYWTFGEIDESLEPEILQLEYSSKEDFVHQAKEKIIAQNPGLEEFCKNNNFSFEKIDYSKLEASSLLLYNSSQDINGEDWWLIYMQDSQSKNHYLDKFNLLSCNVKKYISRQENENLNIENVLKLRGVKDSDIFLNKRAQKLNLWSSIEFSNKIIEERGGRTNKVNRVKYYSFVEKHDEFKRRLNSFVYKCVNKNEIKKAIDLLDKNKIYWVIVLPLSIIGGEKAHVIDEQTKATILNLIKFFQKIVETKDQKNFNGFIDSMRKNHKDVVGAPIPYENILLTINNKSDRYSEEERFLKILKK